MWLELSGVNVLFVGWTISPLALLLLQNHTTPWATTTLSFSILKAPLHPLRLSRMSWYTIHMTQHFWCHSTFDTFGSLLLVSFCHPWSWRVPWAYLGIGRLESIYCPVAWTSMCCFDSKGRARTKEKERESLKSRFMTGRQRCSRQVTRRCSHSHGRVRKVLVYKSINWYGSL